MATGISASFHSEMVVSAGTEIWLPGTSSVASAVFGQPVVTSSLIEDATSVTLTVA